ncbi:MAG: mycofactocin biosynthesis peptidyl-dipeptidase MftE [Acidimicrobiales bacterium]
MTVVHLSSQSSRQVRFSASQRVLVLPIGSLEQHGPHLPLDTDTQITAAVTNEFVRRHDQELVLAPILPYGSSGEHQGFPGTLSIGAQALASVVVELVRSATQWRGILIVSAHGGNAPTLMSVRDHLRRESHRVEVWYPTRATFQDAAYRLNIDPSQRGLHRPDLHGGRTETSIMLALAPDQVALELAAPGFTGEDEAAMAILQKEGVRALSHNGILGDPTGASYEEGCLALAAMYDDLDRIYTSSEQW